MTISSAKSPGCLIVLVDQSQSLENPWGDAGETVGQIIARELTSWINQLPRNLEFELAVLGYKNAGAGAVINSLLSCDQAPVIGPVSRIPTGISLTMLAAPETKGPQQAAFAICLEQLKQWAARAGTQPAAPLVLHIVSGPPSDDSPEDAIESIEQTLEVVGQTVVLCLHPSAADETQLFPKDSPGDFLGKYLTRISSSLPAGLVEVASTVGLSPSAGHRALAMHARPQHLISVLELMTAYAAPWREMETRIRWTAPQDKIEGPSGRQMVRDGNQFFACIGNCLLAFDDAGNELWRFRAGDLLQSGPVLGADRMLRVHGRDGVVYCIGVDGKRQWQQQVGPPLSWSHPMVDSFGNTLICKFTSGLAAIDAQGQLKSRYDSPRVRFDAPGQIHEGCLMIGGNDHRLHRLLLADYAARDEWPAKCGRTRGVISTLPRVTTEEYIISSRDDCVYAFDRNGSQTWSHSLDGRLPTSTTANAQGKSLVCISRPGSREAAGALVCFDGPMGSELWRYPASAGIAAAPIVGDDNVAYFGDQSGTIHAVNSDGVAQWTKNIGSPVCSSGRIISPGSVTFGSHDGRVVALKCSSRVERV